MRMRTHYRLEALGGRRRGTIRITADEFNTIAVARRNLGVATRIEEQFHLLLDNYADFERALLDLALRHLIFSTAGWPEFQDDILAINRRLANLLSAARSYLDQVDHELAALFGPDSRTVEIVRKARTNEHDARFGYRTLEALRNYQQHRGLPVHHLAMGMHRDPVGDQIFVAHRVTQSVSVPSLRRDGGVKAAVLAELDSRGPLVPLMPMVREYVEGLAAVHAAMRGAVANDVKGWEETVQAAMARGRKRFGRSGGGFVAVARKAAGSPAEEIQMFDEFMSRRRLLERRSRHVTMLAKHYVSGRAAVDDA
jgi:hypothetical protein